jgi:hypothetical protein
MTLSIENAKLGQLSSHKSKQVAPGAKLPATVSKHPTAGQSAD